MGGPGRTGDSLRWSDFVSRLSLADGPLTARPDSDSVCRLHNQTLKCSILREFLLESMKPCGRAFRVTQPLRIGVFGGSITYGAGTRQPYSERLAVLLQQLGHNVSVRNYGAGATGTGLWLRCTPAERFDLLISEFNINERNEDALQSWYRLASCLAPAVIVLDLWSWQTYARGILADPTLSSRTKLHHFSVPTAVSVANRSSVCWISPRLAASPWWPHTHPFTTRVMYDAANSSCHDAQEALWRCTTAGCAKAQRGNLLTCTQNRWQANNMQHGNDEYHAAVAISIAWAVWVMQHNLQARPQPRARPSDAGGGECRLELAESRCYGHWGAPRSVRSLWPPLTALNATLHNFEFGELFPLPRQPGRKATFHANVEGATFTLPISQGYKQVSIGYVEHTMAQESAVFRASADVSQRDDQDKFVVERSKRGPSFASSSSVVVNTCASPCLRQGTAFRQRAYLDLPLHPERKATLCIDVLHLNSSADSWVEITDFVFEAASTVQPVENTSHRSSQQGVAWAQSRVVAAALRGGKRRPDG